MGAKELTQDKQGTEGGYCPVEWISQLCLTRSMNCTTDEFAWQNSTKAAMSIYLQGLYNMRNSWFLESSPIGRPSRQNHFVGFKSSSNSQDKQHS